jgi:hypothetical protein
MSNPQSNPQQPASETPKTPAPATPQQQSQNNPKPTEKQPVAQPQQK